MEYRTEMDDVDDEMPGFRFRPTDEELVGYYLRKKIQQKSLRIDLIKQVDIYKYDPWDLPMLATVGEKEWYFYCPRYRKYRNSARPNRVTKNGFWKATGIDKSVYSSKGKCIGLKKSLVFYEGKAVNGKKTDWMMHEFRLPCVSESSSPNKKFSDKSFPPSDSWAICKIFEKTNSNSMVQKALSHSWISQLPTSMVSDLLIQGANWTHFSPQNISCSGTQVGSPAIQFGGNKHDFSNSNNNTNLSSSASDIPIYVPNLIPDIDLGDNLMFQTVGNPSSLLSNIGFKETNQQFGTFSISLPQDMQVNQGTLQLDQWEIDGRNIGFPFNLSPNDAWRTNNVTWDSPPLPSEMSTTYATNKCYI